MEQSRIRKARRFVPELVREALRVHGSNRQYVAELAAVDAWRALAGVTGWTPAMVGHIRKVMAEVTE